MIRGRIDLFCRKLGTSKSLKAGQCDMVPSTLAMAIGNVHWKREPSIKSRFNNTDH